MGVAVRFLNVDLEVEGRMPLDRFCLELTDMEARHLYCGETKGGFLANLECDAGGEDADGLIGKFCGMIGNLEPEARAWWDGAFRKTFDIGYEVDGSSKGFRSELKAETLKQVADVGASVMVTVYPLAEREDEEAGGSV